jgi:hypothetical protein
MGLRRVNAVVAAVFLLSAALQYNDPDPWGWAAIYVAAGIACLLHGRVAVTWARAAASLVAAAAAIWALVLAPQALPGFRLTDLARSMKAESPEIELSRELLGLVIVLAWMVVLAVKPARNSD